MRRFLPAAALALLLPALAMAQTPRLIVELEGGPVWQSYNDVEVPNDGTATRFALDELAGNGPWPAGRLYLTWNLGERHGLRALVAPFSLTETGTPAEPIRFAGADYAAGEPTLHAGGAVAMQGERPFVGTPLLRSFPVHAVTIQA